MDSVWLLGQGAKLYFWLLVAAAVAGVSYLVVRSVQGPVGDSIGWMAFLALIAVLVLVLGALRVAIRRTTQGV